MARATWNGTLLAEAPGEAVEIVEGNVYFPPDAIKGEFFQPIRHPHRLRLEGNGQLLRRGR